MSYYVEGNDCSPELDLNLLIDYCSIQKDKPLDFRIACQLEKLIGEMCEFSECFDASHFAFPLTWETIRSSQLKAGFEDRMIHDRPESVDALVQNYDLMLHYLFGHLPVRTGSADGNYPPVTIRELEAAERKLSMGFREPGRCVTSKRKPLTSSSQRRYILFRCLFVLSHVIA
jgi:hypothetical protein